ncbi:hypothetical protein CEXT_629671 [Caerostris extrusa]|uniref:Uncharacterized protein n=1 Tax=Caerostris extrusa TaxID=172846 RepID=A0AAV4Y6L8_CAEEX|nr:hypothetical protein CEXT_629671 [Caerostris extrusa]
MTKRFQTETLGSDFLLRRANIYDIVCKSLRYHHPPLCPPLPTPHTKRVLHFHSFLISTTAIYTSPVRNESVFRAPLRTLFPLWS